MQRPVLFSAALAVLLAGHAHGQFYFPEPQPPFGKDVVSEKGPVGKGIGAKPAYLKPVTDPYYKTIITRIADDPGTPIPNRTDSWQRVCRHHYQKTAPFNCDGTLLYFFPVGGTGCHMILDGRTFAPTAFPVPPHLARWHPQKPDILVHFPHPKKAAVTNTLHELNVRTGEDEIIAAFEGYSGLTFCAEGNLSADGRYVAPKAVKDGKEYVFGYDMVAKKKYPDIYLNGWLIDWVGVSFSGKYIVACSKGKDKNNPHVTQVYYTHTGEKATDLWDSFGHPSHFDLGLDQNGEDVAVGVAKSPPNERVVIMRRLRDGKERALTNRGATHTSCRNVHRPGWAYTQSLYRTNEVIAIELTWDGEPVIERFAYIPNKKVDYQSETHGAPSFDGRRFVASSNWGNGGGPVQAYVIDMEHLTDPVPTPTSVAGGRGRPDARDTRTSLMPGHGHVPGAAVEIYNVRGQRVGVAAAGESRTTAPGPSWMHGRCTPGIYYIRRTTGSGTRIRKELVAWQ